MDSSPANRLLSSISCVLDAHFHVWEIEDVARRTGWPDKHTHSKIYGDFLLEDYEYDVHASGVPVCKSLFVQTINNNVEETKKVITESFKSSKSILSGVVAGIQLNNCNAEHVQKQIDDIRRCGQQSTQKDSNLLCAARHILALEADPKNWLVREDVMNNMAVLDGNELSFDLLITQQHHVYTDIAPLLRQYPNMHFIVDHIAKPDMKKHARWCEWQALIDRLARHPNVYCKISGLPTEADWETWSAIDDLKPYVEHALNSFGANRCMFASDWPVFKLVRDGNYHNVFDAFLTSLPSHYGRQEMVYLLQDSAKRAYRL